MSFTFDVTAYGAVGDGSTDCTSAFQTAVNNALAQPNATILVPAGRYVISGAINWQKGSLGSYQAYNVSVEGQDAAGIILHTGATPLFAFKNQVDYLTIRNLVFAPTTVKSGVGQAELYFPYGNFHSSFISLQANDIGGGKPSCLYYCAPSGTTDNNDTITFENVFCTPVQTVGIQIGKGSSVFISNSRIIGDAATNPVGLLFTGGMGGVYISSTDIIQCGTALELNQSSGVSNREIFLSNVSLDSSNIGLNLVDSSYLTWQGVWAASCNINVNYDPAANAAILNLSGGTIFNAHGGSYNYGLSFNGKGRLQMTGVVVRNNVGGGFVMNQAASVPIMITGSHFFANTGFGHIQGLSGLTLTGNVLE